MIKQEQTERLPSLRPIQSLQTLLGEKYFRWWRNVSSAEAAVLLLSETVRLPVSIMRSQSSVLVFSASVAMQANLMFRLTAGCSDRDM
jgi:hypothetical protein